MAGSDEMRARASALSGRARETALLLCSGNYGGELTRALWLPGISHISEIFAPGRDEYAALEALAGEDNARLARDMWVGSTNGPYMESSRGARSYRSSRHSAAYVHGAVRVLQAFIPAAAGGFSLDRCLDEKSKGNESSPVERSFVPHAIAASLDRRDEASEGILRRVRDILSGPFAEAAAPDMILGLMKSTREDAADIVCGLLSGSSPGGWPRRFSAELIDRGSRQTFERALKFILETGLVKDADLSGRLLACTGIYSPLRPAAAERLLEHALRCVSDDDFCRNSLSGAADPLETSIALWRLAWRGIELGEAGAKNILLGRFARRQKLAALYFAAWLTLPGVQYEIARPCLDDPGITKDAEMMAWVVECLKWPAPSRFAVTEGPRSPYIRFVDQGIIRLSKDELISYFAALKKCADSYPGGKRGTVFSGSAADGVKMEYSRSDVFGIMFGIAERRTEPKPPDRPGGLIRQMKRFGIDIPITDRGAAETPLPDWLDEAVMETDGGGVPPRDSLCRLMSAMDPPSRAHFVSSVVMSGMSPVQRRALTASLADRNPGVRQSAWNWAMTSDFSGEEILEIEGFLSAKDAGVRRPILLKLLMQPEDELEASLRRLYGDGDVMRRAAAEEMSAILSRVRSGAGAPHAPAVPDRGTLGGSAREVPVLPLPDASDTLRFPALLGMDNVGEMIRRVSAMYSAMNDILREGRAPADWEKIADSAGVPGPLQFLVSAVVFLADCARCSDILDAMPGGSDLAEFSSQVCRMQLPGGRFEHASRVTGIVREAAAKTSARGIYQPVRNLALWMMKNRGAFESEEKDMKRYSELVSSALSVMRAVVPERLSFSGDFPAGFPGAGEIFSDCFGIMCAWSYEDPKTAEMIPACDLAHAYRLGLLSRRDMTRFVMRVAPESGVMGGEDGFTSPGMEYLRKIFPEMYGEVVDPIVQLTADVEKERGETPTDVSGIARTLLHIPGTRHFADILEKMGGEPFDIRVKDRLWDGDGRNVMFSRLLYRTYPAKGEDADTFRDLMQGRNIRADALAESALFAPQWRETIAEYLGWDGFESACWFFRAHSGEAFSAREESEIALYSPIPPEDFADGAFDAVWFARIMDSLGENRFETVCRAALLVSGREVKKRLKMMADAVTGKLAAAEVKRRAAEHGSANHTLAYSLIPLGRSNPEADSRRRYGLLQKFLRDAVLNYDAGRVRTIEVAEANLARSACLGDAARLAMRVGDSAGIFGDFLFPRAFGDVEVCLAADGSFPPRISVRRGEKPAGRIPPQIRGDPHVRALRNIASEAERSHLRFCRFLERAMERGTLFSSEELRASLKHPILGPIVKHLVFVSAGDAPDQFFTADELPARGSFLVAHPVHLYRSGTWNGWQSRMFDERAIQPFRQIFRELYLFIGEEPDRLTTDRYRERSVRISSGMDVMRPRGWAACRTGLRKVFLDKGLIAAAEASGNWFEAEKGYISTVGGVSFSTVSGEAAPVRSVPAALFSEVMRDVDLLVSEANPDETPEASGAVMELRSALARETVRILGLKEVRVAYDRVFVTGARDCTIHLGSGAVYMTGHGALFLSRAAERERKRLFLPFQDDDPETAGILSKILLCADEKKMKDPEIFSPSHETR
ncbi:MAG: DUF4132 domain-containing protein [Synergistaceae bacterium]|jgi:hypothetical protein|nr:DUF4132 domain-containing protein [Synergistaceae bacterium]